MKDIPSSSNQEIPNTSIQELDDIPDPTISIEHIDNPEEEDNEVPVRGKR